MLEGDLFLAVGRYVACLRPHPFEFKWALRVDGAACCGVHYSARHGAMVSHGETEIVRFTRDGKMLWSASGADISTEGFSLRPEWIEAADFKRAAYRFSYADGKSSVQSAGP